MLSRSDIKELITMEEAIEALRGAHAEFSRGDAAMPVRSVILVPEHEGWFGIMPAYLFGSGAMGLKSVTVYKSNPDKGMPATQGVTLLLDPSHRQPALGDGRGLPHRGADRRGLGRGHQPPRPRGRPRGGASWAPASRAGTT